MSLHDILRGDVMPLSGVSVSIGRNTFDPPAPVVPVTDIHHRSTVVHAGTSGILSYDSLQRRWGVIPNNSGLQNIVPGDVLDVYRDAVDDGIGAGTFMAIGFNATRTNTNPALYELLAVSGIVQVHASGIYDIEYRVSGQNSATTPARVTKRFWLQKLSPRNNETGFATVPGTFSYVYMHNAVLGDNTGVARCIIALEAEDMIMVVVNASGGALSVPGISIVSSGCGLTIERLE